MAVAFSRDGKNVTAVSREGDVRTWETATGKETRTFQLPFPLGDRATASQLTFSSNLRWLAVAPPGKVIRHEKMVPHATRTLSEPLLAVYLWQGDLKTHARIVSA